MHGWEMGKYIGKWMAECRWINEKMGTKMRTKRQHMEEMSHTEMAETQRQAQTVAHVARDPQDTSVYGYAYIFKGRATGSN